jgi:hypothetical protein
MVTGEESERRQEVLVNLRNLYICLEERKMLGRLTGPRKD